MFFQLKSVQNPVDTLAPRKPRAAFMGDERGGITIFVIMISILLLVAGGMAVDFERHELARADLQDALDRGVLAATNHRVNYDISGPVSVDDQAKALIYQYISGRGDQTQVSDFSVTVTDLPGGRSISATANHPLNTIFLRMMGLGTMNVAVTSGAMQAAPKLEITLVLDVSGSMGNNSTSAEGTKLSQLKTAAKEFLDIVLSPAVDAQILVSIVPFSQQVALHRSMADQYNLDRVHDFSSCFDYHGLDFSTTAMPTNSTTPFEQGEHFSEGNGRFGCPNVSNAITPFSNNSAELKGAIDALAKETWTATYMGVKWAAALLDPTSRPIVDARIASGDLDSEFAGWPLAWNDPSVRKITVVMSDGVNTRLNEINNQGQKLPVIDNEGDLSPATVGVGDARLSEICAEVKTGSNAVVYTIGFELAGNQTAIDALKDCASDLTTHYEVDGVDLTTAFQNIADDIVNLKLTN